MATNKNFVVKNGLEIGGQEVIDSSGIVTSAALGGQTLSTTDSPSFDNLTLAGALRGPETFVIDPAAIGDNTGTVVIAGDLQVDGTTTTINSTTMEVDDLNITLASGAANASAANGAGITVDGASATILYDSAADKWDFNKPINVNGTVTADGIDSQQYRLMEGATQAGGIFKERTITGTGVSNNISIFAESITDGGQIHFMTGGSATKKMIIDSIGRLYLGTTSTTPAFGTGTGMHFAPAGESMISGGNNTTLFLNRTTGDGSILDFRKDGTTVGRIGTVASRLFIGSDDVFLTFQGAADRIYPAGSTGGGRDAAIDLGEAGTRFKDLYLSGTTNSSGLSVKNPGAVVGLVENTASTVDVRMRVKNTLSYFEMGHDSTGGYLQENGTYPIRFYAGGSERMRLEGSSGNFGINIITAPQKTFEAWNNADNDYVSVGVKLISPGVFSGIHFGYAEPGNAAYRKSAIVFERTDLTASDAQGKIHILNGPQGSNASATLADAKITIAENGNVGINATNPTEKLEVDGGLKISNSNSRLYFGAEGGTSYRALEGSTTGSLLQVGESYTDIALQGNVGINDTTPGSALEVNESSNYKGVHVRGSNTPSLTLAKGTTSTAEWRLGISGYDGDDIAISTGTSVNDQMRMDPSGNVIFALGGSNIAPRQNLNEESTSLQTKGPIVSGHSQGSYTSPARNIRDWFVYAGPPTNTGVYVHMKTNLDCGTVNNTQYTMSSFTYHNYYAYGGTFARGQIGWHNWSGTLYNVMRHNEGTLELVQPSYVSSDGKVVLVARIDQGYAQFSIDWFQWAGYAFREAKVTNVTQSSSATGAY